MSLVHKKVLSAQEGSFSAQEGLLVHKNEIELYVKVDVSLVKQHLLEVRSSQPIGVVIKEIVEENVVSEPVKQGRLGSFVNGIVEDTFIRNKDAELETFWEDDLFQQDNVDVVFQSKDQQEPVVDPFFAQQIDKEAIEREEILGNESEDEGLVGGDENDFDNEDAEIPEKEFVVDMQNFHFEVDVNLDHVRIAYDKNWDDCGVEVIEFNDLDVGGESDEVQPTKNRYKRFKKIRKTYKGKANIKEGDFFVEQEFAIRKQVTEKVRVLSIKARRDIKVLKCDKGKVRAQCYAKLKNALRTLRVQLGKEKTPRTKNARIRSLQVFK
ncbi:hypothetical protein Tco_0530267 [Tanacetum coccineum]